VEFDNFWNNLKQKLPIVFRINNTIPNYENFLKTLQSDKFKNHSEIANEFEQISWYPNKLVFQLNTDK